MSPATTQGQADQAQHRPHDPSMKHNTLYLPAIDGLRALAVMIVVLFHVDFAWMRGGFIGVDVFFVISGFLITNNIVKDLQAGRWSFRRFYVRRVARLFPALFATIACTLAAGYFLLVPGELERLAKSALSATFSVSNVFFFHEAGYFDSSADTKPLLHTWSLSVEEQFYLVWPLSLYVLYRCAGRAALAAAVLIISAIAIGCALWWNETASEMVFFLTPFRAYQFGLGALLALSGSVHDPRWPRAKAIFGILSVCVIGALAIQVAGTSHLFLIAIAPAIAAATFIAAADTPALRRVFASPPCVWLGRRSYSIYLAHWPLIVLWKIKLGPVFHTGDKLVAVSASCVLGQVLYVLVEKRFRLGTPEYGAQRRSLSVAGALLGFVVVISAWFWVQGGFPERVPDALAASASNLGNRWQARHKALRNGRCNLLIGKLGSQTVDDYDRGLCLATDPGKPSYLVIGDSFASGAYLIFSEAYPDVSFGQLTVPGCRLRPTSAIKHGPCKALFGAVLDDPASLDGYTGVILASNWTFGDMTAIAALIDVFRSRGLDVVTIGQRIKFDTAVPTIVLSSFTKQHAAASANARLVRQQVRINELMHKRIAAIGTFVDMIELQCPDDCDVFTPEGDIMYLDASHFSLEGVAVIAERLRLKHPALLQH